MDFWNKFIFTKYLLFINEYLVMFEKILKT
jgi:hypothetical protein